MQIKAPFRIVAFYFILDRIPKKMETGLVKKIIHALHFWAWNNISIKYPYMLEYERKTKTIRKW